MANTQFIQRENEKIRDSAEERKKIRDSAEERKK